MTMTEPMKNVGISEALLIPLRPDHHECGSLLTVGTATATIWWTEEALS